MGRRWHYLDPIQHLVLFNRPNLARLLEATGFEVRAWRTFGRRYRVRYVLDRLYYLNQGLLRRAVGLARSVSRAFLDSSIYLHFGDVLSVAAQRVG